MFKNDPLKVRTAEVRLSYIHLDKPYAQEGQSEQDAKYQATLLLPKTEMACYNEIMTAINAAKQNGINGPWKGVCPPNLSVPIHDGNGPRERSGEPYGEECRGCWVISAKTKIKPQVVHQSNVACELPAGTYKSGDYAKVMINMYAYDANGNRGVACSLGNVMITREGEALGGQTSAADDFADFGSGYSAPAPQAQPPYSQNQPYQTAPQGQGYGQPQQYRAAPQGQGYGQPQQYQAAPQGQSYGQPQQYQTAPQGYGQPPAPQYNAPPPADYFVPNAYSNGGYTPF